MNRDILKFNEIFKDIPAKRSSLAVLSSKDKFLKTCFNISPEEQYKKISLKDFKEKKSTISSVDSFFKDLSQKHEIEGLSIIDRDELWNVMDNLWEKEQESFKNLPYNLQLKLIYERLGLFSSFKTKSKRSTFFYGSKNSTNFFPDTNFLLDIFKTKFKFLFPERKNLVFGLIDNSSNFVDLIMLFFHKSRLMGFVSLNKDMNSLLDISKRTRILSLLETKYKVPCYGVFMEESAWFACVERQKKDGKRAAWSCFFHAQKSRSGKKRLFLEPRSRALQLSLFFKSIF